jgi:hypothetical protein
MSLIAIKSRPFKFAQWTEYIIPGADEATWKPGPPAPPNPATGAPGNPIAFFNKFVYVFQRTQPGISAVPILEIFVEDGGSMRVLDTENSLFTDAPETRPTKSQMKQIQTLALEHTINGNDVFYYFFISRIRVHRDVIDGSGKSRMMTQTVRVLPEVNLKDLTVFVSIGGQDHVAGLDPITVAARLQQKFELERDRYLSWTLPSPDNPDPDCLGRLQKKLLADNVISLMDNNAPVAAKLEPQFIRAALTGMSLGESQMRETSKDYTEIAKVRAENYNIAGTALCHYLSGTMLDGSFGTVPNSFGSLLDPVEAAEYLDLWHSITNRLQESDSGRVFIARVLNDKTHWVHDFVLPTKDPTDKTLKGITSKLGTVLGLWQKLGTVGIVIPSWLPANQTAAQVLTGALKIILRNQRAVTLETIVTKTTIRKRFVPEFDVRVSTQRINLGVTLNDIELRNKLVFAIDVINLGIAMKSYIDANTNMERLSAAGSGVKSMVNIAVVGLNFRRLLTEPMKKAGAIAAIIDVVCSSAAAVDAWEKGRFSVAIATSVSVAGSLLITWGALAALFGAASAPTLVGIPVATLGLVLTIAGGILLWLGPASDLEDFVAHCQWGKSFGSGRDRPGWAGGTLAEFKGNLVRQNEAFLNLIAGFTVIAGRRGKQRFVRIVMNRVDTLSIFRVNFSAFKIEFIDSTPTRKDSTISEDIFINCGDRTLSLPGSAARTSITFGTDKGLLFVEVFSSTDVPADNIAGPDGVQIMQASVILDYFGDGQRFIPGRPDDVRPPPPPKPVIIKLFPSLGSDEESKNVFA